MRVVTFRPQKNKRKEHKSVSYRSLPYIEAWKSYQNPLSLFDSKVYKGNDQKLTVT